MGRNPQAGVKQKQMKESIEEIKDILNSKVPEGIDKTMHQRNIYQKIHEAPLSPPQKMEAYKLAMRDDVRGNLAANNYGLRIKDPYLFRPTPLEKFEKEMVMSQIKEAPDEFKFKSPRRCTDNGGCPEGQECRDGICVPIEKNVIEIVLSPPVEKWVYWKEGGEVFSLLEEYVPAGQ